MKIKRIIVVTLLFLTQIGIAQNNYYYYYNGEKKNLILDKKHININVLEKFQKSSIKNIINTKVISLDKNKIYKIEYEEDISDIDFFQRLDALKKTKNVKNVSLYFKKSNTTSIGTSEIFYIKLKSIEDLSVLQTISSQKNVTIIHQNKFMPLWYKLRLNSHSTKTSLEISNEFFETGLFQNVDPAFMFDFKKSCTNDSNFGNLWGLNNSSNSNIDINVCDAWTITEGNGVNVAVLDQGIDTNHNDLSTNISSLSYDTQNGSSPSVFTNGLGHGTHVSGTIAAIKDNTLQVVGVAPQSKIMSVSNTLAISPNISEKLADGINWAWQNGADVINNSWGDQGGLYYNELHSSILENAITNALTNGRNGNGTSVVFASGNKAFNNPIMDYPANSNDMILTVGAINVLGNRSIFNGIDGSGYGNKLDVVAPGTNILSTLPNQNIGPLNGTSMAAPHVTGIIALILSVKPELTVQDINNIIESTTQKVGNYTYYNNPNKRNGTWNEEVGYGLVDAYNAVQTALTYNSSQNHIITGQTQLTPGMQATYQLDAEYASATNYIWTIPSGCHNNYCWEITGGQGSSTLYVSAGKTGWQNIECKAYNGSNLIANHSININIQDPYSGGSGGNNPCEDLGMLGNLILPPEPCDNIGLGNNSTENIYFKKVDIYNLFGQKIFESSNSQQIDISQFAQGIYIIKLELSNNELIVKKIYKDN